MSFQLWRVQGLRTKNEVHFFPLQDAVDHETTGDCICGPAAEEIETVEGKTRWLYRHHMLQLTQPEEAGD